MTSIPMRPMLAAVFSIGMALCAAVHASVVIGGTRVIYDAHDTEVTIKLTNEGKSPALTQVWLDNGNLNDDPSAISTPFDIVPPLGISRAGACPGTSVDGCPGWGCGTGRPSRRSA